MKIGVSVFRKLASDHSRTTTQGMLMFPKDVAEHIGSHMLDVTGTLVAGLLLAPALADTKRPAILAPNGRSESALRLWLRTAWIGGNAKENMKAFTQIEVEEPRDGVLKLPPMPLQGFAWERQVTDRDREANRVRKREVRARAEGRQAAETLRAIGHLPGGTNTARALLALPRLKKVKAAVPVATPRHAPLIDLGDLMSAIGFVNEALATGLVVHRTTETGEIRLALKGGIG